MSYQYIILEREREKETHVFSAMNFFEKDDVTEEACTITVWSRERKSHDIKWKGRGQMETKSMENMRLNPLPVLKFGSEKKSWNNARESGAWKKDEFLFSVRKKKHFFLLLKYDQTITSRNGIIYHDKDRKTEVSLENKTTPITTEVNTAAIPEIAKKKFLTFWKATLVMFVAQKWHDAIPASIPAQPKENYGKKREPQLDLKPRPSPFSSRHRRPWKWHKTMYVYRPVHD